MTRWKPSVSSCCGSALFASTLCAVAVIPLPPNMSLIEIGGMTRDMLGKAERMAAHKVFGACRVARFDRLDDVHVVADRAGGAIALSDRLHPDHPHMRKQIFGERNQYAVAAHANDGLVKFDIHFGIFVEPRMQLAVLEFREHTTQ